jgi:ParB-like chromosome segregation protein Spo0J
MKIEPRPIEIWDVDKITPYAKNAKKHPPEQIKKLAAAIKEFGWTQPIVVDKDGEIIIGHGRRLAAIELGLKKVPVDCRRDLTPEQVRALRLSDNRVTSTEYDMSLVQEELKSLFDEDYDLSVIGFDERELDFAAGDLGEMDDDFFVEDISGAVEKQKEDNARAAKEADDIAAPVADALGFKRVTIAQSRQLRELMSRVEVKTGKSGIEALLDILVAAT